MTSLAYGLLLLATLTARAGAEEKTVPLVLRLSEQAGAPWSALPTDAADARVTRLDDAPRQCVASALGEARRLLGQDENARRALREVSWSLAVPRTVIDRLARRDATPALLAPYLTASGRGAQVAQPLGPSCGAYYELRDAEGQPALAMQLEAGCGCTEGGVRIHLEAQAALFPDAVQKGVLRLRAGEPRYAVLASCEPCERTPPGSAASVPLAGDPCAQLCGPLAEGLAAWQSKVTAAAGRLADFMGKATALELQVTTDRRELSGAEAARSRTRAVLERISALQARIKGAQAELERVRQISRGAEQALAALRRVAGDTGSAEGRCRAQCQARPPAKERASAGEGPSAASAAGGGGISTGVLVAGGVAAAAGGAVLATRGGSDAPPTGGPDFSGRWHGTKVVISNVGAPAPCRAVYDEDWLITQAGSTLEIAVDTIVTDCGDRAACGGIGGCTTGPPGFQRRHVGTVSGSIAFVYPYPDYVTPECALSMTLQGTTLRGSFSACRTEQPLPVFMDVVLQRVTR